MARVVVEVMPKPEILDPQGKAITSSLRRFGFEGLTIRQGKRFEIEIDGALTEERRMQIDTVAEAMLANTVIESFQVQIVDAGAAADSPDDDFVTFGEPDAATALQQAAAGEADSSAPSSAAQSETGADDEGAAADTAAASQDTVTDPNGAAQQ